MHFQAMQGLFFHIMYMANAVFSVLQNSKASAISCWMPNTESISSHVFMRLEVCAFLTQLCTVYWCELETGRMRQKENPMQGKSKCVKLSFNQKYDTNELDDKEMDGATEQ